MTIKKNIQVTSILLLTLFLAVGSAMVFEYQYLSRKANITDKLDKQSMYLQMLLRGLNEIVLNEGMEASTLTRDALDGFNANHSSFIEVTDNSDLGNVYIQDIDAEWREIENRVSEFVENHYLDMAVDEDEFMIKLGKLITDTESVINKITIHNESMHAHMQENSKIALYAVLISFLIILAAIATYLFKLYRSVSYPIEELISIADSISRGDLERTMDETRNDEFGVLARHFNKATHELTYVTGMLEANSDKLSESNDQLRAQMAEGKRKEHQIRQAYELTQDILEKAPFGVYLCNTAGKIEYVNNAMLDISGETHEQFINLNVNDFPKHDNGELSEKINDTLNGNAFSLGPFEYTSYIGKKRSIRKMLGIPYEQEREKKALIFVEDITALHKTKEDLLLAQSDWEETFNTITDIITVHDADFNIVGANEAAKRILKIPDLEIHKKFKCYQHYHGTDAPPENCLSCKSLETKNPVTLEIFEPHLNAHIEIRSIPRLDKNNRLIGFIHVCRDISERKKNQEIINTQVDRLQALRSIDKAILGSFDIRIMLDVFLEQIMKQLHRDAVAVLLLNENTLTLEHLCSKGFRSHGVKNTRLRLGQSYAGRAALDRSILNVPDLKESPDCIEKSRNIMGEGFTSYCVVPLIAKGKVKGVLEVFNRTQCDTDNAWIDFLEAIADQGAIAIDNAGMFDKLQRSNIELMISYDKTIEGWSKAMDMRDKETEGHSQRVTEMSILIAQEMGIDDEDIINIRRGALLHDMGKLGIPDSVLLKPGKLTDEEWVIMKKHPEYAYEMLHSIEHLRPALDIPYYHHEKWDGTGYPKGLQGEEIPLSARIFAAVDVWDALCSDRPYRPAWPKDPDVVEVFFRLNWEVNAGELTIASDDPAVSAS